MKEDEYIDLDKINAVPNRGEAPGFSKEENPRKEESKEESKKELKKETPKKTAKKTTKKKTTKKTKTTDKPAAKAKKTKKRKKVKSNNKKIVYFLLGLILLAVIVLVVASFFRTSTQSTENKALFLINGEPLMENEVETRANWLRLVNGMPITDEQAIELSIDVELMYQEAKRRNITITDEEINSVFEDMRMSAGMTEEELKEYIENLGIEYDLLKQMVTKEMHARELSTQDITEEITEEEKLEYYNNNLDEFVHDELARIRHIQVSFKANQTENETLELANEIKEQINENRSNFCDIVEEYSDDLNTKFNCGEYVFEKQPSYDEELIETSFSLEDDEITIVESLAGYHVLWKIETIPEGFSDFEDVKWRIESRLEMERAEEKHLELIDRLRENAEIEDYTGRLEEILEPVEEIVEINMSEIEELEDTQVIDVDVEDSLEKIEDAIDEATRNVTEITEEITESQEDTEELETQPYETVPQPITTDNKILRLAKCLTEQGAKMYTVYWSPHGEQQADAFGEYFEHIISIECDADGVNPKVTECKNTLQKEFPVWPTWQINGELYEGYQNLNKLSTISGCPY